MAFKSEDILTEEEIASLFDPSDETAAETTQENKEDSTPVETKKEESTTEENPIDPNSLFEDTPESVGGEEQNKKVQEDTPSEKGTSPYIYSSLAKALKEEGILLDLDDADIDKISNPEDFADAIEKQVQAKFDERQKRIDEALNNGVEPDVIRNYENTLQQLNSITEEQIKEESDSAENFRKNVIYRDYINKGFSEERAKREVNRSVSNGTDVEDAIEALASIKETVQKQYDDALEDAKNTEQEAIKERNKQAENLKKSVLEDKQLFGELELDKATRKKILDNIVKPVYKDPKTGEQYSAIQKFEMDNREEFLKNVGIIYTLTDGFKNLDGLVKGKVKREVKKGLKELETTLNNTARNSDGSLDFMSGVSDTESYLSNFKLDL